jgi:hypothetical protein
MRLAVTAGFLLLFASGCGDGVKYVQTDPTVRKPKPESYLMLFPRAQESEGFRPIGTLTVDRKITSSFSKTSVLDDARMALAAKGKRVGADAILDVKTENYEGKDGRSVLRLIGTAAVVRTDS